jgi:transcriptional regulator with XRE-family HTH domain
LQRVLGKNVRALRESRRLTQEQFAHIVDRNRTYIGSIERGERNIRLRTVERLAELFGADPLQLLSPVPTGPAADLRPPASDTPDDAVGDTLEG